MAETKKSDVTFERPEMEQVSGGEFIKFEEVGDCAEGYYQGYTWTTILQNGMEVELPKYRLENDLGGVEFLGGTQINEILPRVPTGAYVMVTYTGRSKTTRGFQVKQFEVQLQKGVSLAPAVKGMVLENGAARFNPDGADLDPSASSGGELPF